MKGLFRMGKYAFLVVREYLGERVSLNIKRRDN